MFCGTMFTECLCDVLGAEPLLGPPSNLHHAAPGKNKISLSPWLSPLRALLVVIELKHLSTTFLQTQCRRIVVTEGDTFSGGFAVFAWECINHCFGEAVKGCEFDSRCQIFWQMDFSWEEGVLSFFPQLWASKDKKALLHVSRQRRCS